MASFYAELQVAGATYPVRTCSYEFTQATSERGRVVAKVRHGLVLLMLDVPTDDLLLAWAHAPYQPQAGKVIFYDVKGGPALETLAWEDGQCVGYQEEFVSGNVAEGTYVCRLTIATPKLTMQPGGPLAYVAPTPGEHGSPASAAATVLTATKLKAEELATGILKKVITPAGEVGTEILGVGLAAIARTASLTLSLLLTPTNSRDDPGYASEWELYRRNQAQFKPLTPAQLRLAQLERLHEQGDLTADEEKEYLALLATEKGIRVRSLADLDVTGRYKKQPQGLPGFHFEEITYTKRTKADTEALRRKFDSVRAKFMKKISSDPTYVPQLRAAGFDDKALKIMQGGNVPTDWQVHHKLPLDDGGDNSFNNLLLIKNSPYHSVVTGYQKTHTGKLQPGETVQIKWPTYSRGIVYPPKKP